MLNFSIIIPHHNIPKLLERCLASIPQRDDTEVIVVDDNSDPEIVDFDNFPGKGRADVTILHNDGKKWAGTARNRGIEAASGRWLIFADADDFFNFCLSNLLDKYAESDADIVFFKANSLDGEMYCASPKTERRVRHINKYFNKYLAGDKMGETLLRYAWGEPWAKMYKRSLVEKHNIRFDETPIHEDTIFTYTAGYHARKVAADPHCIYCVTYRPGSLSSTVSEEKLLARVEVFARKERFMRDNTEYTILDKIDRSHYEAWTELVLGRHPKREAAKETLKRYGLCHCGTYLWFLYFSVKLACKATLRIICKSKA